MDFNVILNLILTLNEQKAIDDDALPDVILMFKIIFNLSYIKLRKSKKKLFLNFKIIFFNYTFKKNNCF